jgi:hypothetical protein
MEPQKKPEVIELDRYRKAAEARAAKKAAAEKAAKSGRPAGKEKLLGSRPNAGLLLILVLVLAAALLILPKLF